MRNVSKMLMVGTIGIVVAGAASAGVAVAAAEDVPTETNGGSIVEDFSYPGAAAILAEHNVELISGDGNIVFADCNTPPVNDVGLIQVWRAEGDPSHWRICFKVLEPVGRLDLRIPQVFEIMGDGQRTGTGHNGTATVITDGGEESTKDLDPDGIIQFGLGGGNEPTTLLRLTVKP